MKFFSEMFGGKKDFDRRQLEVGKYYADKGVYAGVYKPSDAHGRSLGRIFDVYAFPHDLQDRSGQNLLLAHDEAINRLFHLRNLHGRNGILIRSEQDVKAIAFDNPEALKNWHIPSMNILRHLYQIRDTGALKNSFVTAVGPADPLWEASGYWSSTTDPYDTDLFYRNVLSFKTGQIQQVPRDWYTYKNDSYKYRYGFSLRPVAMDLVSPA